jgi:spore maturation protein CgeB
VLNVFRETHHFNREQIEATSLNPRVYEALACGSLVVSEWRQEIADRVPELPTFRTADECVEIVRFYLGNLSLLSDVQAACAARLASDTYANRLQTVLTTVGLAVSA